MLEGICQMFLPFDHLDKRTERLIDRQRDSESQTEKWTISSFDQSMSEPVRDSGCNFLSGASLTMISVRDASASKNPCDLNSVTNYI